MHRNLKALLALLVLLVPITACGGDDDGGSVQAYCDASKKLDEVEDFPSDEQFDELADTAPEEISDDIDFVVERFKEANDNPEDVEAVFSDPEITDRIERIEAFEVENCGREADE